MTDGYVLKSSVLKAIHNGDIDMGMVTLHEYRLLKDLSERIDRRIQRVPVSDVAPVRHGRWIVKGDAQPMSNDKVYGCSLCDDKNRRYYEWELLNYCPNCGADMREVDNEPDS